MNAEQILTRGKNVLEMEMDALRGVMQRLDAEFPKAVEAMVTALTNGHKIVVAGVGKSGNIGYKIVATLNSTGAPAVLLDTQNALHGDLGIVCDGDVCIAMSFSGETAELLTLLPFLKRYEMTIIAMTGKMHSSLAQYADITLDTAVEREACPLNLAPTSSSTAMLAMGDALAMALLEARSFTAEDFAKRHPGGSLGRALLTKVADIMRSNEECPILPESTSVSECLQAMTHARTGACILTRKDDTLAGVFTHGDFVRAYQADPLVGSTLVLNFMTANPVSVPADALAVEAVNILTKRRIDEIVVVDTANRPVGLVDSQDLARLKLI